MNRTTTTRLACALAAMTLTLAAAAQTAPAPPTPPALTAMYAMAAPPAPPALPALAALEPAALPMLAPEPVPEGMGQNAEAGKDDLFAGTEEFAKNASDVTEINMDPQSLGMVGGSDGARAHRMVLNVVRTYSYDKPGMYDMAAVEKYRAKLNTGDWYCSVHTRNMKSGSSTDVCGKRRTDGMKETAIITVEPKSLTFIHTIRKGDGGASEMVAPMAMLEGAPMLAELEAPKLAAIDAQVARLEMLGPQMERNSEQMERLNSPEFQQRMAEMSARFNSPEFQKRMEEMSATFDSPEFKRRMEEMQKRFDSPEFKQRMEDMQKSMQDSVTPQE
jgi:hypothetical protein